MPRRKRVEIITTGNQCSTNLVNGLAELDAELAEIDENLIRNDLTVLERGEHLARRKEIYELKYPETRQGAQGGGRNGVGTRQRTETEIISFSADTAAKTGQTDRTIRQEVQIANKIAPEVKEVIRDTELADAKTQLIALAGLNEDEQKEAVAEVQSGL